MFRGRGSGQLDAKGAISLSQLLGVAAGASGATREEGTGEPVRKRQRRDGRAEGQAHRTPGPEEDNVTVLASLDIDFVGYSAFLVARGRS